MKLDKGIVYYPQSRNSNKIKWLCICAHQDDNEIMAVDGILKGYHSKTYSFALVVTADGGGSARTGEFKDYTDEMMKQVRIKEQEAASEIGRYNSLYLLNYTSSEIKDNNNKQIVDEYIKIIKELKPEVIYTHSILDKHPTHIGVVKKVLEAIKALPKEYRPKKIYGCEVWRGLDWIKDDRKIDFDLSRNVKLQKKLLAVFKSQIAGGKSYLDASIGRRYANATYFNSHAVDSYKLVSYGIDLLPVVNGMDIKEYALSFVNDLKDEIVKVLS